MKIGVRLGVLVKNDTMLRFCEQNMIGLPFYAAMTRWRILFLFRHGRRERHKIRSGDCGGGIGGDPEFAWSDSRGLVEDIVEVVRRVESACCRDVLDRHFLKGEHLFGLIQSGEHDLIADRTP